MNINNLGSHVEAVTRPPERLPPGELVKAWQAIDEQFRHCFLCESLTEAAADDLVSALERRRRGRHERPRRAA